MKKDGTITLKQAWDMWRMLPENMQWATKSRRVFNDLVLNMHGNKLLTDFSKKMTQDILFETDDIDSRTKAASLLVDILIWGSKNGYCRKPMFDETVAGFAEPKENTAEASDAEQDEGKQEVAADAEPPRNPLTLEPKEEDDDEEDEDDIAPNEHDAVNHPEHYTSHPSGVECITITRHYCFSIGNAIKYLWRAGLKIDADKTAREKEIEDLRKARWYILDRIKQLKAIK